MKKKKIILYHTNPLQFGGIDTFDYNFCKKMNNKYDILFLYRDGNLGTINRLKKLNISVEKYNENKKYVCDICLLASAWGGYPESVIAKSGRYIQMVHADYIKAKEVDFIYERWHKTTEHVAVGKHVAAIFKKLYPAERITTIYNILDDRKKTKSILKLVSATRVSKEKGYNRMLKLAKSLKKNNIKFRWIIFTDLQLYNQKPFDMEEFIYMKPSHDIFDYIVEADYGVQLSDTEGYCYFVNECLQYGTPVISTNYPSIYESIEDGKNGYLLDMDLSNLDLNKIVNCIPKNFTYKEKGTTQDWIDFFSLKNSEPQQKIKIVALNYYFDSRPELIIDDHFNHNELGNAIICKDDVYYVSSEERADELAATGYVKIEKE